uniref:Uncharacterized protein n=1 Tax=Lactuca sativa TaxID=4236 RepID=A0A9R1W9N5_LACSA|nr:hypothetical protein LSAT_V11C200059430 [Lactuca sativa]
MRGNVLLYSGRLHIYHVSMLFSIKNKIENGKDALDTNEWLHPCYMISIRKVVYLNKLDPLNGRSMWLKSCHKKVGRPKKKNKMVVDEAKRQTT